MHDSMISKVGLVMITLVVEFHLGLLVVEFHLGLLVEVEENGLREWSSTWVLRVKAESNKVVSLSFE